jgi:hypothetical protein
MEEYNKLELVDKLKYFTATCKNFADDLEVEKKRQETLKVLEVKRTALSSLISSLKDKSN